jgi:hypothetical protein
MKQTQDKTSADIWVDNSFIIILSLRQNSSSEVLAVSFEIGVFAWRQTEQFQFVHPAKKLGAYVNQKLHVPATSTTLTIEGSMAPMTIIVNGGPCAL